MIPTQMMINLLDMFHFDSEDDYRQMFDKLFDVIEPWWAALETIVELVVEEGIPMDLDTPFPAHAPA